MQFSTTFIVEDSEPMVHHNLGRLLREAGYILLPDGHYQRGTREGSRLSFDPSMWFTRLLADTHSTPDFYTQVVLNYDVQTAGESLKYHTRRFWYDEVEHIVTGLGGRTDSFQVKLEKALGLDVQTPDAADGQIPEVQASQAREIDPSPSKLFIRNQRERQMRNGASWFFWISALSLINSVIYLFKSDASFIIGLGVTQVVDIFASLLIDEVPEGLGLFRGAAIVINLIILSVFIVFGLLARRGKSWAFLLGMGLYFFDGVIFLLVSDWFAVVFHGIALFGLARGYLALRELRKLDEGEVIFSA